MIEYSCESTELREALGNVLPHVSRDNQLPVLCSVVFELAPDGLTVAATDRYTLGVDTVGGEYADRAAPRETVTVLMPSADAAALAKSLPRGHRREYVTITCDPTGGVLRPLTVKCGDVTINPEQPSGTYPGWRQLFHDKFAPRERVTLGSAHLAKLHKSATGGGFHFRMADGKPLAFRSTERESFHGLIMPIRSDWSAAA